MKKVKYELVDRNQTNTNYDMFDIYVWKRPYLFGLIGEKRWCFKQRTCDLERGLTECQS